MICILLLYFSWPLSIYQSISSPESLKKISIPYPFYGNPHQYSCLENPMDRGAWQATVHGVATVGHDLATKLPPPFLYTSCLFALPCPLGIWKKKSDCQSKEQVPFNWSTSPLKLTKIKSRHLCLLNKQFCKNLPHSIQSLILKLKELLFILR